MIHHGNNNINKYQSGAMNNFLISNINRSIVDETKIGDVFKDDIGVRKIAHYVVLVDVTSVSSDVYLKGDLLHLTANSISGLSKFRFGDKPRRRTDFHEMVYIGKIVSPAHIHPTRSKEWACSLVMLVSERIEGVTNSS